MFDCCSLKYRPIQSPSFQNQCTASLRLFTEITRIFDLIQTSPDLRHICFEYLHGHSTLSCSPGKSLLSLLVYIGTPPLPPSYKPPFSLRAYRFTSVSPSQDRGNRLKHTSRFLLRLLSLTAIHSDSFQRTLDGRDASRPERHSWPSGSLY